MLSFQLIMQLKDMEEKAARTGNVMLGCFVTAYARLYLHDIMNSLPDARTDLLYSDTV